MTSTATRQLVEPHWHTQLFAGPADHALPSERTSVSPRAAYQMLLYRRAKLLDLRTDDQRRDHGEVAAELRSADGADVPLVVLCHDGQASSALTQAMRASGDPRASAIEGGYRAWLALGLPTT